MKIKYILFLLLTTLVFSFSVFGQSNPNQNTSILNKQLDRNNLKLADERLDVTLMHIFSDSKTPAGVAWAYNEDSFRTYDFQPQTFNLKDVLSSIIKVKPEYSWKEENGVINFLPNEEYTILNTVIPEFKVDNSTQGTILKALVDTAEFKNASTSNKVLKAPTIFTGGLVSRTDQRKRFSVDCKNLTVREILNEIVRKEGESKAIVRNEYKAAWAYYEYSSSFNKDKETKRYYKLYFFIGHDWIDESD